MSVNNSAFRKWGFGLAVLTIAASFLIIQAQAAEISDAIAVRIMPNPNHYSIETWYKQQGYKGAPQKLIVDGYEAVRDGRTVFINAANVDEKNKIYTNIYLISYNQDPNIKTIDILGQLVSHWKFNSNLSVTGECSISKIFCAKDNDCPVDYLCSTGVETDNASFNSLNKGKCLPKIEKKCLIDDDCPVNLFCDSAKAKVTRDTKRLGQLGDVKEALRVVGARDARYPELAGGTYVAGNSVSTWPSWQETFWPKLSGFNLATDPINVLGDCLGYESKTCWNKDTNQFYRLVNGKLSLPAGSYAYLYSAAQNGINYNICATFETEGLYDTAEGQLTKDVCLTGLGHTATSVNTAPRLVSSFLAGESGLEFNGYIKAVDDQNDAISWKIDTSYISFSSWSSEPTLRDSGNANQKKIYAATSGRPGDYPFTLTLTDSRGTEAKYPLLIKLTANKPIIEADSIDYFVNPVLPLKYTFFTQSFSGLVPSKITMAKIDSGSINPFALSGATEKKIELGPNRFEVDKATLIPGGTSLPEDKTVTYRITVTDEKNNVAQKDININLKAEKPALNFDCDTNARIGQPYPINGVACFIGETKENNHSLTYQLSGPLGLSLSTSADGKTSLSGTPVATVTATGTPITIIAINEYGVTTQKTFFLKINSYCGDGYVQTPNSEGKGGVYNDGLESCDGMSGITTNVAASSVSKQYGCVTKGPSSYPILDNGACVFASGDKGGGYCGDNICQFQVNGILLENACNCEKDCSKATGVAAASNCAVVTPPDTSTKCGNDIIEVGEECDGLNLNGKTCQNFDANYNTYGLSCGTDCKFVKTGCSAKSCYRNNECSNGYVCGATGKTTNDYYCTGTQYSHGCNTAPFTTTTLKNQCAGSYIGGTIFSDLIVPTSTKYNQCKTACESARYENNNQDLCDWVVSGGRCIAPTNTVTCTSFTYSNWRQCLLGIKYRDVLTSSPAGCTGGDPETWAACNNCGNGAIDSSEVCDGSLFGTNTCQNRTKKYWSGSLICTNNCSTISETSCSGYCGDGTCQSSYENNTSCSTDCPPAACVPKTCADIKASCGSWDNGCNGAVNCGGCNDGDACTDDSCSDLTLKCDHIKNYNTNVACKVCGDGLCSKTIGETNAECPADCPATCLNNSLDTGEQCEFINSTWTYRDGKNTCALYNPAKPNGTLVCSNCQINSSDCSAPTCAANTYYDGTRCVACGYGKVSVAGSVGADKCVDCLSDNECGTGYYCTGTNSSFTQCSTAVTNTCQKKCWNLLETDKVLEFREGDTVSYYSCSATSVDDPRCGAPTYCPTDCNSGGAPKSIGSAYGDSCYIQRTFSKSWYDRSRYKCYHTQYAKYFFNDSCPMTVGYTYKGGTVNENGSCVYVSYCGDGNCDANEDSASCPSDCLPATGYCGDGYCDIGEDYYSCPSDC